jgi:hypothetical protein
MGNTNTNTNKSNILCVNFKNDNIFNNVYLPDEIVKITKFLCVEYKNFDYIPIPTKFIKIPSNFDTIKFTNDHFANTLNKNYTMEYSRFLECIPSSVSTLIYDLSYNCCSVNKNLCTGLPDHVQFLKLNMFGTRTELFPYLNNLPFNLSLLTINYNERSIIDYSSRDKYKLEIGMNSEPVWTKGEITDNNILLNSNIKLPFGCKIQLPNYQIDDVEKLYFKLIYITPRMVAEEKYDKKCSKLYRKYGIKKESYKSPSHIKRSEENRRKREEKKREETKTSPPSKTPPPCKTLPPKKLYKEKKNLGPSSYDILREEMRRKEMRRKEMKDNNISKEMKDNNRRKKKSSKKESYK